MMSLKENQYWSSLNEQNIDECLRLVDQHELENLKLPSHVHDFILDLATNHRCDPQVLFYTLLSSIGHFCAAVNVYNLETKQLKPITVYEIIIAPSGRQQGMIIKRVEFFI